MAVMQLEGEAAQLRQVARLYANGDITLDDYRNIRTVMIDAFVADVENVVPASSDRTVVPVELEVPVVPDAAPAPRRAVPREADVAKPETESPLALLAILGAGAMLLIVAALAMGLPK